MELFIRNGKRFQAPIVQLLLLIAIGAPSATAQSSFVCSPLAPPTLVRIEGLAERLGDIVLRCTGGTPGGVSTSNLTIFVPGNITNRVSAANVPDVNVTVDIGSGPAPAIASVVLSAPNAVSINGLTFNIPASGVTQIRISNIRANVNQLGIAAQGGIVASLASNGFSLTAAQVTVAIANRGLLAINTSTTIFCTGSPLPATLSLASLFAAGTRFQSTRITEGYAQAFTPKDATSDTGTRILVSYTGLPTGARLFLPDVIAGSSALQPTAGGDLGAPQSGGVYAPSASGSLLLARVAGGTPVYVPGAVGSPAITFLSASEVPLSNGAGTAVYEVVDSNPFLQESAQFPTFLGLAAQSNVTPAAASETVSLAPVSTVGVASTTEPIPRFVSVPPPPDCGAVGDCGANYLPSLTTDLTSLQFSGIAGGQYQVQYVRIHNQGGGQMPWTASITYQSGSGWLTVDQDSGINNSTLRVDAHPEKLAAGTYHATLLIDAGPLAGSRTIPVGFAVNAPAPVPAPPVQPTLAITSVTNAAASLAGPLVAGSLGTVKGPNLSGKIIGVTFDGIPATLLYNDAKQINFQVPQALALKTSAQIVVTVDGISSAAQTVALAAEAPAIFPVGILNQDNGVNSRTNPAPAGSVVQIFSTGLISTGSEIVTAKIHDRDNLIPLYAGSAPGVPGVQQVNVAVPADLPAMMTEVKLCSAGVCSLPVAIYLQ